MEQVPNTSVAVEVKRSVRSLRQMFEPQGIKARPPVKSKPMWLNKGTNDSTTINGSPPSSMSQNAVRETGSRPETVSRYRTQETGNCSGEGDEPERHSLGDTNGRRKDTSDRLVGTSGRLEDKSDRIEGTSDRLEDTYDTIEGTSGRLEDTSDTIQGTSGRLEDTSDTIEGTSGRLKDTSDRLEDTSDRLEGTSGNDKIKSLLRLVSRRRRQRPQHFLSDSSVQPLPSVPRDGADGRHTYPAGPEGVRDTSRQNAHSQQPNRDLKSVRMGPCVKQMTQAFNQQCLSYNSPSPSDRLKRNVPTPPGPTNSVARNKETASCYPCTDNSSDWPAGPGNNIATNEDAVGKNTILLPSLNYLKPLPDSQGDFANRNETDETNFGNLPQQDVKEFSSEDEDGWDDSWDEASGNSSDENDVTVYNVEEEHQNSNSTDITWHEESDQYDDLYENIAEFRQIVSQSVAAPSKTSAAVPLRSSSEYMASDTNPTPFMGRSLSLPTIQTKHRVSFSDNECYSDAPDTDDDSVDDATPWQCTTLREWMGSGHKLRWSEMPRVKHSGVLKTLTPADIKLQEAMFEILSSEAVYINRLDILISVFYASKEFSAFHSSRAVISEEEREDLFPDIIDIWDISREFLSALEKIWDSDVLLNSSICDVITDFAVEKFQCYENYMIKKRQQDKKMDELSTQPRFVEALRGMHSDPKCKMLSLGAYLLEPFQRFMRYPLLLKEVLGYTSDEEEKQRVENARETIESMISNCNQMVDILKEQEIFDELVSKFVYKNNLEKFDFASEHRWLVKKSIAHHILPDSPPEKVQLFLFNDVLFMTRLESAHRYEVMNYCPRIALETGAVSGPVPHPGLEPDSLWILVLLDGQSQHDISHVMAAENPSEAEQWREHLRPEIQEEFQITYKDWYPYMVSLKKTTSCSLVPQVVFSEGEKVRVVSVTNNDELYLVERPCDGTEGWISRVDCAPVMDEVGKVDKLRKCYRRMDSYGSLPSLSP